MQFEHIDVFPWNQNFETGIKQIDEQHQILVALINTLANSLVHEDQIEMISVFEELADYASYHFETEENIWKESFVSDPWFETHMASHTSFLPRLMKLQEDKSESPQVIIEKVVRFLIRWLALHIIDDDKKMSYVVDGVNKGLSLEEAKLRSSKKMGGATRVLIDTVINMYDDLSLCAMELLRERLKRKNAEQQLLEAKKGFDKLSITDQLTGLYSRGHFNEVFQREFRRARRNSTYISLVSLDIDSFRNLNDAYGRKRGDEVLKRVGEAIGGACCRSDDFAFRVGGEEFMILSVNANHDDTFSFAEKVRTTISDLKIPNAGSAADDFLSVSLGVTAKIPGDTDSTETFLVLVEKNLHRAKSEGRNRING
ncbi:GGDEF domain-containing protein [Teredinibacter haidensis]|uniref:GGDEF domain-containing protein n=1 Tax=Teredinibacter haidensis TaxID=2731755 RepID=UPI0009489F7D|nr:bacteriohemerythrin [Teredinibacter haidensis]